MLDKMNIKKKPADEMDEKKLKEKKRKMTVLMKRMSTVHLIGFTKPR